MCAVFSLRGRVDIDPELDVTHAYRGDGGATDF